MKQGEWPHYLFEKTGLESLSACAFSSPLVALDFDGTLASIVDSPTDAHLTHSVWAALEAVAKHYTVCIISGRSKADVTARVPASIDCVIGNHGIEGLASSPESSQDDHFRQLIAQWHAALKDTLTNLEGIWLEDKGLSLSIHYRNSPDQVEAAARIQNALTNLPQSPRIMAGKCVINLLPQTHYNKGTALLAMMRAQGKDRAIFIGDDITDEDVFDLHSPDLFTVRVGKNLFSQATYYLQDQDEIERFLQTLVEFAPQGN